MDILFILLFVALIAIGVARTVSYNKKQNQQITIFKFRGIPYFIGAVIVLIVALSFVSVDAGSIGVVKKFGNPVGQLNPGAHLILPWEDVTSVAVQTRVVKPKSEAASKDLQVTHAEVTLAYHVDPLYATYILVNLNNDAEDRVIDPAILEAVKAVIAKYEAQELISQRPLVRDGIEAFVKARIAPYHIVAETVSITDFDFSPDFNRAIEQKVTAQQNAEKAKNDLTRIQVEAEQQIAQAKGEAEALRSQKEQITPGLLQLRTIEMMMSKWDGHLPQNYVMTGANGALPMMDILRKTEK